MSIFQISLSFPELKNPCVFQSCKHSVYKCIYGTGLTGLALRDQWLVLDQYLFPQHCIIYSARFCKKTNTNALCLRIRVFRRRTRRRRKSDDLGQINSCRSKSVVPSSLPRRTAGTPPHGKGSSSSARLCTLQVTTAISLNSHRAA